MASSIADFTSLKSKFVFATTGKVSRRKSGPGYSSLIDDRSLIRKSLMRQWGRESRFCQKAFPQARALHLLRKSEDMPIRMLNFGRFVVHVNDFYALQQRTLIQRVSDRIRRRRITLLLLVLCPILPGKTRRSKAVPPRRRAAALWQSGVCISPLCCAGFRASSRWSARPICSTTWRARARSSPPSAARPARSWSRW